MPYKCWVSGRGVVKPPNQCIVPLSALMPRATLHLHRGANYGTVLVGCSSPASPPPPFLDLTDHEKCTAWLGAVCVECDEDPRAAHGRLREYAAAILSVMRMIKADLSMTIPPAEAHQHHRFLALLAAACRAFHALVKASDAAVGGARDKGTSSGLLELEASSLAVLLSMPLEVLPLSAAGVARLTAKSVLRNRCAQLAASPAAALPVIRWAVGELQRAVSAASARSAPHDVAAFGIDVVMLLVDRMGRGVSAPSAATPVDLVRSVEEWLGATLSVDRHDASGGDAVVHRMIAEDFLSRHVKRLTLLRSQAPGDADLEADAMAAFIDEVFAAHGGVPLNRNAQLTTAQTTAILSTAKRRLSSIVVDAKDNLAATIATRERMQRVLERASPTLDSIE